MPVSKLSCSSLLLLLRNPMLFKLREILGVYDVKMGPAAIIGRAFHHAIGFYHGGDPDHPCPADPDQARAEALQMGLDFLEQHGDAGIDYGKTGSREKMLREYANAVRFYFAEEVELGPIVMVEKKLEAELKTDDGQAFPLPAVGRVDLVHRHPGGFVEIVDYKTVASFTPHETEDYAKIVQAMFYYHLLLAAEGIRAARMVFREIKRTENREPGPQVRDYVIPFDHEPYKVFFRNLYADAVKYLGSDPVFLPNLTDPMDGEHAGLVYAQGLVSADMSDVEVMHKVREVALTSKKFVSSRADSPVNAHLLPEEKVKLRLAEFGIPVEPVGTVEGPSVTQYRFKVSAGVRMSALLKHRDDIARALEAEGEVRILAPISGTALVGVEVERAARGVAKLQDRHLAKGTLNVPLGVRVDGTDEVLPLDRMPHLLVAGSTGSGKSVLLNVLITALCRQLSPKELRLTLIDPKRVELAAFAEDPHVDSVVIDPEEAAWALDRLTLEMDRRYEKLAGAKVRTLEEFNASRKPTARLPRIVCVIDEFADLMLRPRNRRRAKDAPEPPDVERSVVRLAQMARAVGIHLVLATQRPSVDVLTGLIKANFPTRVALTTASETDSRVILGQAGAEKLSGRGDLLLSTPLRRGLVRLQGYTL